MPSCHTRLGNLHALTFTRLNYVSCASYLIFAHLTQSRYNLRAYLCALLNRDMISVGNWDTSESTPKIEFSSCNSRCCSKVWHFLCRYWRLWSLFVSLLLKSWFIKSWFSGRQELVLKSWFSGRRFKSQSDQLSITISNNPLGVNTIYIRSFRYTRVITSRKLQLK